METPEVFAFGTSTSHDTHCPVVAATGEEPEGELLTVAEEYDEVVYSRYDIGNGTIPASVAESCWNEAVARLFSRSKNYLGRDDEHSDYLHTAGEKGKEIYGKVF